MMEIDIDLKRTCCKDKAAFKKCFQAMSSDPKQLPLFLGHLLRHPLRNKEPLLRNLVIPVVPTVLGFGKPFGNLIRGPVGKESSLDFLRLKDLNLTDFLELAVLILLIKNRSN